MGETYKVLFLVIILKISAISAANFNKYCHIQSCPNPLEHTGCEFSPNITGSECGNTKPVIGLTDAEKQKILSMHNDARRMVASGSQLGKFNQPLPSAVHMPSLTWDTELEQLAQTWANQCPDRSYPHDRCRDLEENRVQQSIVISGLKLDNTPGIMNVEKYMSSFIDEASYVDASLIYEYKNPSLVSPPSHTWGHYTNMIWAKTTKIGCGKVKYVFYENEFQHSTTEVLVCNYSPAGSIPGEQVYQTA